MKTDDLQKKLENPNHPMHKAYMEQEKKGLGDLFIKNLIETKPQDTSPWFSKFKNKEHNHSFLNALNFSKKMFSI